MNNKKDFFTGAGFDETNGNNQQMNNGIVNNNQGMMNQQPIQQMANNIYNGMPAQPTMNNTQMMMQQPMNNGMMNQSVMNQQLMNNMMGNNQGMMQQPNPGFGIGAPLSGKANSDKGIFKVLITVAILVIIVVLLFVFGHKTLSCTQSNDYGVFSAEMTSEIEYWFGKAISRKAIMKMDIKDLDDEEKKQVMELVEELADSSKEEDESIKTSIKETDDSITLTAKRKITNDDEVDSYDKEKKGFKDEDYVCK